MAFSLGTRSACSAQPPQWVTNLTHEVFTIEISSIVSWEEKQMTWYNINGAPDQSDSVTVNTLIVRGTTTTNNYFVGAIPVMNEALNALGTRGVKGQTCSGECGCQRCEFKYNTRGCDCLDAVPQPDCNAWCKHVLSSFN